MTGRRTIATLLAAGLACLPVACSGGPEASTTARSPTVITTAPTSATTTLVLFFAYDRGGLVAERRRVPAPVTPLAAAEALAAGPREAGSAPALPPGTRVLGADVADGVATVDLSPEYESGYPRGGSAAELAVTAPLVHTLTGLRGVRAVRITVGGSAPEPVGAQLDLSGPLTRADLPSPVAVISP